MEGPWWPWKGRYLLMLTVVVAVRLRLRQCVRTAAGRSSTLDRVPRCPSAGSGEEEKAH